MAFLCYNKIKKAHDLSTVSGRQDSNLRHLGPKPSTLPSWATSRINCLMHPRGVEPLTAWFVVRYSIQLS